MFARWYFKGRSRKTAMKPLEISLEVIEKNLRTNNREDDKSPIVELGFSLGAWNGNDELSVGLNIHCGSFSKYVGNAVVIDLPRQEPPADDEALGVFRELLRKFIDAWDPDVAVVSSHEFLERAGGKIASEAGGWLTYRRGKGIVENSKC